jgi:carbamate kinase
MGPKILAMINYLEGGGAEGIITNPENMLDALNGLSGTIFTKS